MKLETNENIGKYLSTLITKKYSSKRKFCKDYIETRGGTLDETNIRNMSNRISQILNGKKSIQIYDLPIFTQLLNVSCEEILSAGTEFVIDSNHMTNYQFAFTKDVEIWERYINDERKMILNTDEYGNTVIDYALKYKNYDLLKYLMVQKYIWFIGDDEDDYCTTFRAGTSIERRTFANCDLLNFKLADEDKFRREMIILAIENKDFDMLTSLRAREIPPLYQFSYLSFCLPDFAPYYDNEMIIHIANAHENVLEYFSDTFVIKNRYGHSNKFIFPYINNLLELLISNNHCYTEIVLKRCIKHNLQTYNDLKKLIEMSTDFLKFDSKTTISTTTKLIKEYIKKELKKELDFNEQKNVIKFRNLRNKSQGIITNIISLKTSSKNTKLNSLITELNKIYNNIINIIDDI